MITDYKVVEEINAEMLVKLVQELMKEGWVPFGNFTAVALYNDVYFYQPMVKDGSRS